MINKVEIYLENRKLDIDNIDLALTYSFSNLFNPLEVTGDYSKTITVKGTPTNNEIFGQIWNFDRIIINDENAKNVGVYFNASKRANCSIFINGGLFKSGYVKLNAINSIKGVISYEITFYSQLCNVLHKLNEKRLVDLNFVDDLQHIINRNVINDFWNNEHELSDSMTYILANNGLYDNFQNDKMIQYASSTATLPEIVDVIGGVELDECAKGEYRSYKQRPALKVDNLCNLIASDVSINLDKSFFNIANPYYNATYLTLPIIEKAATDFEATNIVNEEYYDSFTVVSERNTTGISHQAPIPFEAVADSSIFSEEGLVDLQNVQGFSTVIVEAQFRARVTLNGNLPIGTKFWFSSNYRGDIITNIWLEDNSGNRYKLSDPSTHYLVYFSPLYGNAAFGYIDTNNGTNSSGWIHWNNPYTNFKGGENIINYPIKFYNTTPQGWENGPYTVEYEVKYRCYNVAPIYYTDSVGATKTVDVLSFTIEKLPIDKVPTEGSYDIADYYPVNDGFTGKDITIIAENDLGTNVAVNKNIIIDNEIMAGDFLINYTKLFGLLYDVDGDNISIKTRNAYFSDYKILDWNDKIDYNKNINVIPIPFEDKYIEFNYEDGETYYETYYKRKFDIGYATAKVNTGYEFNTNSKNLINNQLFRNTICSQEKTQMIIGTHIVYAVDEKIIPALFTLEDNQRNQSETKYNLLFDNGLINLNTPIVISDDSKYMLDEDLGVEGAGEACWISTRNPEIMAECGLERTTYRQFSTITSDGRNSLDFGYPRENYANYNKINYPETSTLYNNFWKSYISEIYNADNKIVKCYIKLTPNDMFQFSFRNFIKAFGCIWHINKINNYNPLSDEPTEVEMIKVTDINAYINGQKQFYPSYNITYDLTNVTLSYSPETVQGGTSFETTLYLPAVDSTNPTAGASYGLTSVKVEIDGIDVTDKYYDNEIRTISIPVVNGDITIRAVAQAFIQPIEDELL